MIKGSIQENIAFINIYAHKVLSSQSCGFSNMYGCESWTIKKNWAPKDGCFWTVVLEKTPESPSDCKEIKPVNPKENQSQIFIGRADAEAETPILWLPTKDSLNLWFLTGPPEWQRLLRPGAEGKLPGPAFASVCSGALTARTEPELIGEGNKWNSPLGAQALQKRCLVSNSEWPGANDLLPELGYLLLIMGPVTVATELLEAITECIHSKRWEQYFPRENSS